MAGVSAAECLVPLETRKEPDREQPVAQPGELTHDTRFAYVDLSNHYAP